MFRRAYLAGAVVWAAIIPAAALAATRSEAAPPLYALALSVYAFGHAICHQIPARSFQLSGVVLPVCARCTGIYAGAAAASLCLMAAGRLAAPAGTPTVSGSRRLLMAAFLPTALTLVYEWTTGHTPGNWIRAFAGLPLGAAVTWLVAAVDF